MLSCRTWVTNSPTSMTLSKASFVQVYFNEGHFGTSYFVHFLLFWGYKDLILAQWHLVPQKLGDVLYIKCPLSLYQRFHFIDMQRQHRYSVCVNHVESQLSLPIARAFTDAYFPPETRVSIIHSIYLFTANNALPPSNKRHWSDSPQRKRVS